MPNTRIVGYLVGPITIEPGIYKERIYVTNYLQNRRTNQAPSIYGDGFLQNINILRELIFVNKESGGDWRYPIPEAVVF